jgi:hypothetical protein
MAERLEQIAPTDLRLKIAIKGGRGDSAAPPPSCALLAETCQMFRAGPNVSLRLVQITRYRERHDSVTLERRRVL